MSERAWAVTVLPDVILFFILEIIDIISDLQMTCRVIPMLIPVSEIQIEILFHCTS